MYIYIYIYVYIYTYTYTYVYIYVYKYIHIYTFIDIYIYVHKCLFMFLLKLTELFDIWGGQGLLRHRPVCRWNGWPQSRRVVHGMCKGHVPGPGQAPQRCVPGDDQHHVVDDDVILLDAKHTDTVPRLCPRVVSICLRHFRFYEVVSLHTYFLPYKYRQILKMVPILRNYAK